MRLYPVNVYKGDYIHVYYIYNNGVPGQGDYLQCLLYITMVYQDKWRLYPWLMSTIYNNGAPGQGRLYPWLMSTIYNNGVPGQGDYSIHGQGDLPGLLYITRQGRLYPWLMSTIYNNGVQDKGDLSRFKDNTDVPGQWLSMSTIYNNDCLPGQGRLYPWLMSTIYNNGVPGQRRLYPWLMSTIYNNGVQDKETISMVHDL
ncbi:unnamed protein product [Mytilus edulis]|uniref:Uncharacterized protein n=1 Tax=Mytilus edulis TaxID=6550 RepID=A0A8S3PM58_MYTED|nr:unnamed protein product [Mytilus edulis]